MLLTTLRIIGNIFSVLGYLVALQLSVFWGAVIHLIGMFLLVPFCIKLKLWDVLAVFGFFGAIDIFTIFNLII